MKGTLKMEIQEMIEEINIKLKEETQKHDKQRALVEELGRKYSEQIAILRVLKRNISILTSNLAELKRNQAPGKDPKVSNDLVRDGYEVGDENFEELTRLLDEAVDISVKKGLIVEEVMTKTGTYINMRRSIINRARNAILRNCNGYSSIDWVGKMTDDDIKSLRNIGKKTGDVIRVARSIVNGQEI